MSWLGPNALATKGSRIALIEGKSGSVCHFDELARTVDAIAGRLAGPRAVIACRLAPDLASVAAYLGAVAAGHVVLLIDPTADDERLERIRAAYEPAAWLEPTSADSTPGEPLPAPQGAASRVRLVAGGSRAMALAEPLGLLMTTSGSTGSPKLVRLSHAAVQANAESIVSGLAVSPDDIAITTLPLHYSYGLSVLHTHLLAGATTVLTDEAVVTRGFWEKVAGHRVTSMAGVPYTYEMLRRLRFAPRQHPSIRVLTQAGGRLGTERILEIHEAASQAGVRFHVMYGQTEATARISILPSDALPAKLGSVGLAVRLGRLSVLDDGAPQPTGSTGEITFDGPNVMMGYAESGHDLALGDVMGGTLATGDLGHLDDEGHLYVTGRKSRLAKVFGARIDLDDVERRFLSGRAVAVDADGRLGIVGEFEADEVAALQQRIARGLALHSSGVVVRSVTELPRLSSGKVDYQTVRAAL